MTEKINWRDYEKTIDGIHYTCSFNGDLVIWGQYEDDPHGINNEARIHLKEFLDGLSPNSQSCRRHIKEIYGDEKLERFIYFVQQQFDLSKK